ncbi:MAG: hypothetical protein ABW032_02810 [Burkholderiaceae bacterium]
MFDREFSVRGCCTVVRDQADPFASDSRAEPGAGKICASPMGSNVHMPEIAIGGLSGALPGEGESNPVQTDSAAVVVGIRPASSRGTLPDGGPQPRPTSGARFGAQPGHFRVIDVVTKIAQLKSQLSTTSDPDDKCEKLASMCDELHKLASAKNRSVKRVPLGFLRLLNEHCDALPWQGVRILNARQLSTAVLKLAESIGLDGYQATLAFDLEQHLGTPTWQVTGPDHALELACSLLRDMVGSSKKP